MKDSDDLSLISCEFIEDREGKPANDGASETPIHDRIKVGIAGNSHQRLVDALHEFGVQIAALARVPFAGLGKFSVRVGVEANAH